MHIFLMIVLLFNFIPAQNNTVCRISPSTVKITIVKNRGTAEKIAVMRVDKVNGTQQIWKRYFSPTLRQTIIFYDTTAHLTARYYLIEDLMNTLPPVQHGPFIPIPCSMYIDKS